MNIPENIAKYKPCNSVRIRNDNGTYRVYRYHSIQLPSGKWSSNYGDLIGKIIPDVGFVPNKRYEEELRMEQKLRFEDSITDLSYGRYGLLMELSHGICAMLEACFTIDVAAQIYCYALILCANGFMHVDQVDGFYKESVLSLLYKGYGFRMGADALGTLLRDLGSRIERVEAFEQNLIDGCSGDVAIDGHAIRSMSNENDLSEPGYKASDLKAGQVNLLIAYDIRNDIPLMYRTYRGSSVDKKSAVEFLESRCFKNTKFVVDKGFYSEKIIHHMSTNGNCYIIPLPSSNANLKRIKETLEYASGEFIYQSGKKSSARVVYHEEYINEATRIIVYKDEDENNSKRKSYVKCMELGESGYTKEGYRRYCDWWGVCALQTTSRDPASAIYDDYKGRWSIETFNNYIKNDADFNDLKIQDYYSQHGFDFIMLVTGLIHSSLSKAVRSLNKPSISTIDILIKSGHMRMVKGSKGWTLHNTKTKDIELFQAMGFNPAERINM